MTAPEAGYRYIPRPDDLCVEAWAPTRERCLVQVIDAVVDSFIQRPRPEPSETIEWVMPRDRAENLMGTLLEAVDHQMEVYSRIPVTTTVERLDSGWRVRFELADLDRTTLCGAVPTAVTLHDIRIQSERDRWHCVVSVDS
ncbi:archease [Nocardia terrae]|uniref:archease n=1 Tax=Nocardia terrae TaxID=2675851 RepID=UPI0012FAAC07|nr:archease [Nocardia terrae]